MPRLITLGMVALVVAGCASHEPSRAEVLYAQQMAAAGRTYTPVPITGYGSAPMYSGAMYPPPPPAYGPTYDPPAYGYPAPGCRNYETRAWIDNRYLPVYGVVCQQWDGSWRIVR